MTNYDDAFPYPDRPVAVYTALYDPPGMNSGHIGVFTTEKKARLACQRHADSANPGQAVYLNWKGTDTAYVNWASENDGDSYMVVMSTLDVPTGEG
jgi:hypothetical protein